MPDSDPKVAFSGWGQAVEIHSDVDRLWRDSRGMRIPPDPASAQSLSRLGTEVGQFARWEVFHRSWLKQRNEALSAAGKSEAKIAAVQGAKIVTATRNCEVKTGPVEEVNEGIDRPWWFAPTNLFNQEADGWGEFVGIHAECRKRPVPGRNPIEFDLSWTIVCLRNGLGEEPP
ncbi:MAG TPA: hypothetical protein VKU19_38800 [Bryobacteraceae bacterium]|nr:hypothetical protein [Bryobacteraceae bacterium]